MYKSTNFLANHNFTSRAVDAATVVVGCTKVLIS